MCIYKRVSIHREEQISLIMRNNFFSVTCKSYLFIHTKNKWTQETKPLFPQKYLKFCWFVKISYFQERGICLTILLSAIQAINKVWVGCIPTHQTEGVYYSSKNLEQMMKLKFWDKGFWLCLHFAFSEAKNYEYYWC